MINNLIDAITGSPIYRIAAAIYIIVVFVSIIIKIIDAEYGKAIKFGILNAINLCIAPAVIALMIISAGVVILSVVIVFLWICGMFKD